MQLIEILVKVDEITLLELLDITSEELVERFPDKIEERHEYIQKELENLEIEE